LVKLRSETMTGYLEASGEMLSTDDQYARVLQDFHCIRVVMIGRKAAGMIKVVEGDDEWRLVQVQIEPRLQGKGIGAHIVGQTIAAARAARKPLTLSVLKVNPATRLYERLGFRVVGETHRSYEMRLD